MKKSIFKMMAAALVAGGVTFSASAQTDVSANITGPTTWTTSGSPYILKDIIYVENGATLTIDPGVVIRGTADTSAANDGLDNDNPGTLVISRDGKIFANGTPTNPIIFTDENDDAVGGSAGTGIYAQINNNLTGQYGGVIVLGRTYVSASASHDDTDDGDPNDGQTVEGLTDPAGQGWYGGNKSGDITPLATVVDADDFDDSGEMSYINIRYPGEKISANNEINGLTLGGVGINTEIHHIETLNTLDDGVEWFGGTVNVKYLSLINSGDDGLDWDEGFRGKLQYVFVVMGGDENAAVGSGLSNTVGELDGADKGDDNVPFSAPTVFNATAVGFVPYSSRSTTLGGDGTGTDEFKGLHFRDGGAGRFINSVFINFGSGLFAIENKGGTERPAASGNFYGNSTTHVTQSYETFAAASNNISEVNSATTGQPERFYQHFSEGLNNLDFQTCLVFGSGPVADLTLEGHPYGIPSAETSGGPYYSGTFAGITEAVALPIVALSQSLGTPGTNGEFLYFTDSIDPRAANDALTTTPHTPGQGVQVNSATSEDFFETTSYIGAFGPDSNWLAGWASSVLLGMVDVSNVPGVEITASRFAFEFTSVAGEDYLIQSASSPAGPFTDLDSVTATSSSTIYLDTTTLGTRKFYKAIEL